MKPASVIDVSAEQRMNRLLKSLNLDYAVLWQPDPNAKHHAMTFPSRKIIEIYATDEFAAWDAFLHEVLEIRLSDVMAYHVGIENTLLALLQGTAHAKKEAAIEQVVKDMRLISQFEEAEAKQ